MKTNDFSVPRRMSKSSIVVIYFKQLKNLFSFFLAIIILNGPFKSDNDYNALQMIGIILCILFAYLGIAAIATFINYFYKKYYIKDGNLIFMQGMVRHETISIPIQKIYSMRTKSGFMYRLLDMKSISFDTLATQGTEMELILDNDDWNNLISHVNIQNTEDSNSMMRDEVTSTPSSSDKSDKDVFTLSLSNLNLIKGAFCQNHFRGMTVLFGIIATFYSKISSVSEKWIDNIISNIDSYAVTTAESLSENITENISTSFILISTAVVLLALYIFIMLLWIGKVIVQYFNMNIRMDNTSNKQLFFESGLISRLSCRFSFDKICTLYVKQNFMEKLLGCCTIKLNQAFNATSKNEEGNVTIYGSNTSGHFLEWWLGKDYLDNQKIKIARSGNGVFGYTVIFDYIISISICIALYIYEHYIWMTIPVVYFLVSTLKGIMSVKHSCITLHEDYMIINTGKLADVKNYLKYDNIEIVRLTRTPFTKFYHRVSLGIYTNGTSFKVRSLKEKEAQDIYEFLVNKTISKNETD